MSSAMPQNRYYPTWRRTTANGAGAPRTEAAMPVEIERKFLVTGEGWRDGHTGARYCQGYITSGNGVTVRVRRAGPTAMITIKGRPRGIARPEFEYPIPVDDAEELLDSMCRKPLVEKIRYDVPH